MLKMTDVFNIDQQSEGFRRNNLDWRKLRENYNHIAISKLQRGIKPLPITLLLKLFGPRKVLDTYVVSRRTPTTVNEQQLGNFYPAADVRFELDMRDKKVAKPLNFPADSLLSTQEENGDHHGKAVVKVNKHDALPSRPVFQRSMHVPGRYFPKPTPSEEHREILQSRSGSEYHLADRPRTLTPRSVYTPHSRGSSRIPKSSGKPPVSSSSVRSSGYLRGPVCKATETSHKGVVLSGRTIGTPKTPTTPMTPGSMGLERRSGDVFSISFRNEDRDNGLGLNFDLHSELHGDYYSVKKRRLSARQVSFPGKGSEDFSTVLQGRPKTLHSRRDGMELINNHVISKETRAKTHVGFIDRDPTSS